MLKFLRKRTKAIVWGVVISFVAWGGYAVSVQFEEASRSAGRIFGKEVSFRNYLLANRAVQIFTPQNSENPPSAEEIEVRTWEFLVLSHEAKRRKITVTDEEARQEISSLLGKEGSVVSPERYAQWVRITLREEPREFEHQMREHLRIRKLLNGVRQEFKDNQEENLRRWLSSLITQAKIQVPRRP